LANCFLLISKTEEDASVGLLSKNLQTKLDSDFILTPVVGESRRSQPADTARVIGGRAGNPYAKPVPRQGWRRSGDSKACPP
jgi:hypothetical protein